MRPVTTAVPLPLAAVSNFPAVVATAPEGPVPRSTSAVLGREPACKGKGRLSGMTTEQIHVNMCNEKEPLMSQSALSMPHVKLIGGTEKGHSKVFFVSLITETDETDVWQQIAPKAYMWAAHCLLCTEQCMNVSKSSVEQLACVICIPLGTHRSSWLHWVVSNSTKHSPI